jgi:hypothetical protein
MTFTELRNKLEPVRDWQPESMLELMRRIRWAGGRQGSGPFCQRSLQHTLDRQTLRECCLAIDAQNPPTSLRDAFGRLGFPLGGGVTALPAGPLSLGAAARRVIGRDAVPLRFLSYNTYLLQGLQIPLGDWIDDAVGWDALKWFGIPFGGALLVLLGIQSIPGLAVAEILSLAGVTPSSVVHRILGIDLNGIQFGAKRALEARASEMGPALSPYDICCLSEVWTEESRNRIVSQLSGGQWQSVSGPDKSGAFILTGSGLFFLAKNRNITRTETMIYDDRGERNRDSDAWSNKGVMLNEIDLGFARVEFFQTHLYYGGGIKDNLPGFLPGFKDPSTDDRFGVWRAELGELADFYRRRHRPENVAIITGDFNMSGSSLREYLEIRRVMDGLGMRDLWAWDVYENEPSEGLTCRFTDGDIEQWVSDFDAQCAYVPSKDDPESCNDRTLLPALPRDGVGRYDFVFMQSPSAGQRGRVEVSRSVRRPFKRLVPSDRELFLSDHMGVDLTLFVSPT